MLKSKIPRSVHDDDSKTATVSDKGQVTLPKPLRAQLGIRPGSRLVR